MRKIADADELEGELRRLLAYAQSEQPSRSRVGTELAQLAERLTGVPKQASNDAFLRIIKPQLDRAVEDAADLAIAPFYDQLSGVHDGDTIELELLKMKPSGMGESEFAQDLVRRMMAYTKVLRTALRSIR